MENVKNLVGKKFKPFFDKWCEYLESLGYTNYYSVLNGKDFGIPQNRERVFMISIHGEHTPYEFPKGFPLKLRLKDMLEDKVDEKYYLPQEMHDRFLAFPKNRLNNEDLEVIGTTAPNPYDKEGNIIYDKCTSAWCYSPDKCISTLSARDYKQPKQIVESETDKVIVEGNASKNPKSQANQVISKEGVSMTLCSGTHGYAMGYVKESKDSAKIIEHKLMQNVKVRKYKVDIEKLKEILKVQKQKLGLTINDISNILNVNKTTVEHWFRSDDCFSIPDAEIWLDLKKLLQINTDEFMDKSIMEFEIKPNEYDMTNRVYDENGIACSQTSNGGGLGGPTGLYLTDNKDINPIRLGGVFDDEKSRHQAGSVRDKEQLSPTLDTAQGGYREPCIVEKVQLKNSDIELTQEELPCCVASRGRNVDNPSRRIAGDDLEQRLEPNRNDCTNTLTSVSKDNYVMQRNFRIRRLTCQECFRLMGLKDYQIDLIQNAKISDTQQYKMAGNSIIVDVLEYIFSNLFKGTDL